MKKIKLKLFASIIGIIAILSLGVAGCVSPTALNVAISSPEDGAIVTESMITVTGTVSGYPRGQVNVGEQTASVSPEVKVNGIKATVDDDGGFSAEIELAEGENVIEAVAMFNNVEARDSITVTYTPPVSELSVEIVSPEDGVELAESPVTVTGTVSDTEATVMVNNQPAEVADDGSFSAVVELTEGENIIEAVAVLDDLEARDSITVTFVSSAPVLTSIEVAPATPENLTVGGTMQFTATGIYEDGSTADITSQVTWTSSDETVATIDTAGLATGLAAGTTSITASLADITSPEVLLTVVEAEPVLSLEITSPEDGAELSDSIIDITGIVSDASAIVALNNVVIEVAADGTFFTQVELTEGENTITVSAVSGELQVQDSITVTYNPTPANVPTVEITSPEDGAILTESLVVITGNVSPAGAVVTVNGVVVASQENNNGTFSAQVILAEGQNTITAAAILGQGQLRAEDSITVTYTVAEPVLTSIEVAPATPENLTVGGTMQFTATGIYEDGSTADITSQVTWTSSDETVATIDAAGLATGLAAGTTSITASLADIASPEVLLTVVEVEPVLTSIEVAPATPENLTVGGTMQFTATGIYEDGSTADITSQVTWTSSDETVATIDAAGLATGLAAGTTSITASLADIASPEVLLTVVEAEPVLTSIEVAPATPENLTVGGTMQFTATGIYEDGSTADITSQVTWTSSDETVATIDAAGLATGLAAGTTSITASLADITSPEVLLTVVAP